MALTYYEILGVAQETPDDEIKASYRRLAIKYHPDKNPNDSSAADKFKEISLAYRVLGDQQKRKAYDAELAATKQNGRSVGATVSRVQNEKTEFDLADSLRIFMDIFRMDRVFQRNFYRTDTQGGQNRGSNIQMNVSLSLLEMMEGTKKKISVSHKKKCTTCDGTGDIEKKTNHFRCSMCDGQGKVRIEDSNEIRACMQCFGTGVVAAHPCTACAGSGAVQGNTELMVTFQKGISEGNYISIPGMGNFGLRGSGAGDLILLIHEEKHPIFTRRGYDLEREIVISLSIAVQGGKITVSDLKDQQHEVRIRPCTNPGALVRLDGLGLPYYNKDGKGNLYIRINVEIPDTLSPQAMDAFKAFAVIMENDIRERNFSLIGRFNVIPLPEEQQVNRMQAAFDTANRLVQLKEPIAFDMSNLTTITSGLIGQIVSIHRRMENYNEKLIIVSPKAGPREVFSECSLEKIFKFADSVADLESIEAPIPQGFNDRSVPLIRKQDGHWLIDAGANTFNSDIFTKSEVLELFKKPGISIGLDLQRVEFINSMIIGEIIKKYKTSKKTGNRFFLLGPRNDVMDVLTQTHCDKLFTIVKNKHELRALQPIL